MFLPSPLARALDDAPGSPAYLLRMERMHADDNVCVLVRSDGQYHLERSNWDKTDILEGTISEGDLHQLEHWVGDNELFDLTQDKIVAPLFTGPKDQLILGVNRPGYWQILMFPAPATWQRYGRSVVPLVQWFDELRKAKHRARLREEQGRNSCMPPRRPELTTRSQARRPAFAPFVFIVQTTSFKGKEGDKSCAVIYPDGRYHREKKSQHLGSDEVATAVYEGSVKAEGMEELRGILASPEIQNRREPHQPWGISQTDSEITALTLPQEGKARTMFFWEYGPSPGLKGAGDAQASGLKALEPLRQWLNSNVEDPDVAPLANKSLSDCVPPRLP
jgi:hypothetical protein